MTWVLSCFDPVSNLQLGLWYGACNGLRITTDKAHIATWCKNCIATASDSATTSECRRYCSTTFWSRSGHRSSNATPTFACPSVLHGELWRHIWKMGLVYKRVHTADGTRQNFQSQIYLGLLKTVGCRQMRSSSLSMSSFLSVSAVWMNET